MARHGILQLQECTRQEGKPLRTFRAGRRCKWKGCVTKLNHYNSGNYCGAHKAQGELHEGKIRGYHAHDRLLCMRGA